ncbi:MAG: hypothetical protein AAF725_20540 [Acidobacteriota bacterium]
MVDGLPEPMWEVAVAAAAFAVFLLVHGALWRRLGAERAGFVLMVGLWLASVTAALLAAAWLGAPTRALTVIALDGSLMALYLHLYTGMLRSVSLRLLGELSAAGGRLRIEDLGDVYSPASLGERLAWLEDRGWVAERGGVFRLTAGGERFLSARHALARALIEGPTG